MDDEENDITPARDYNKEPHRRKQSLSNRNKNVTENEVSANFTEIEKEILNATMPVHAPAEVKVCCVRGCKSRSDKDDAKISYHRFPPAGVNTVYLLDTSSEQRDLDQREAWRQLLRLEMAPTDDMVVCSIHFKYQDFIDPETDTPSERALHPQAVPIRCPPSYEGLRETILNEIRKERRLLAKSQPSVTEEACALRVQQLASEWSDGEESRAAQSDAQADEGFTQEEWLNEDEWMSEAELEDEKIGGERMKVEPSETNAIQPQNADVQEEPLEAEYLSDMDSWDELSSHQPDATVNGDVTHTEREATVKEDEMEEPEEEKGELDGNEEEEMRLYDFGSSASMSSNEDILDKFSIDLRAEQPTTFLPLLGDAATRILSHELDSVKRIVKETHARVREARTLKNRQADEIVLLRRKIKDMEQDRVKGYNLESRL